MSKLSLILAEHFILKQRSILLDMKVSRQLEKFSVEEGWAFNRMLDQIPTVNGRAEYVSDPEGKVR